MGEPTKQCSRCKIEKPFSEFYNNRARKDGKVSHCKTCVKEYRQSDRGRELGNASHRRWVAANREALNAYNREWLRSRDDAYRTRRRKYAAAQERKAHREAIDAYGGVCACCGENEPLFLQIDHIDNDGAAHRRVVKIRIARWLKRNGYPPGFQVLCCNCNFAKHINGGVCPHHTNREAA